MSDKHQHLSLNNRILKMDISINDLIGFFRRKCSICGHQRIMHDEFGKCEGVMNKPCTSGCDNYSPE